MKIGFVSLGCPKNLVDSEVMMGLARQAGHELTPDASDADVIVVNTCAFIESAREESIDAILEMARHKVRGRCRRLVVTGCLAQRYGEELKREMPEIDALLGVDGVPEILGALGEDEAPQQPGTDGDRAALPAANVAGSPACQPTPRAGIAATAPAPPKQAGSAAQAQEEPACPDDGPVVIPSPPTYLYDDRTPRALSTPSHLAYVKIAEGCNYRCAFCVIPRLRGAYRSRPARSVVREARELASRGVRELILIAQDTTYYGRDRGERGALARLLRALDRVDGLQWIRLLYLYPTTLTTDTLTAIAECDKVCKYVDLPLQHASDAVLRRMRRPGTRAGYERLIAKVRRIVPGAALRTAFIVGFPGETVREFQELERFVRATGFDHVGVFTYSHEEGTPAGRLVDTVPRRVKAQRQRALMALQRRHVTAVNRARIGERVTVMVDGSSPEHPLVLRGRLQSQAPDIDAQVYLSDVDPAACRPGDLVEAEVLEARGYDLLASVARVGYGVI